MLEELHRLEPRSMSGFAPFAWQRAAGFQVWDAYGNRWLDFTSAVVLANAGHAHPKIAHAIREQLDRQLMHSYCNPSEIRLLAVRAIKTILPPYLDKVFLLTTGAEAVEGAIKLMRLHSRRLDPGKIHILAYENSFHGRTMGAQNAGGFADQQEWMGEKPAGFHHIPFPDCASCSWGRPQYRDCGAECWQRSLEQLRRRGDQPDLICLGKGMTSSLPTSAVAGRAEIVVAFLASADAAYITGEVIAVNGGLRMD
jgi:4-aminobutyrate aminotransferase-like enzyme